ncbi:Alkaline phytoceramidase (aPHC) [Hibiscus syriacus]|uniref:Alkaline phytoceramidase (APHC) n=1 Tax=Hibiscus syriacus TaxID=106335 RepID=A0A6A3D7N4_HIBSY|nr:pathogen-associated molecular patterns-induced protein A70-like [Hibiscus syriacus]KAE8735252.1 Alkaline phytoceramidase (aPHC) [Hibiscus syriacus]
MLEEPIPTVPCSIWTSLLSWFTPAVFFVFLNLTIGTIYFTSTLTSSNNGGDGGRRDGQDNETNQKLARSPSVLQRLKSINFCAYRSQEPVVERTPDLSDFQFSFQHQISQQQQQQPLDRSPSLLQRVKSINLKSYFSPEKSHEKFSHYASDEVSDAKAEKPAATQGDGPTLDEIYSQLKVENHHVSRTKSDTKPSSGEVPTKLPRKMKKSASVKSAFRHFEEDDIVEARRPATVREGKDKSTAEDDEDDEVDARADDFINRFKHQLKLQKLDSIIRYKETVNRASGR